MSSALEPPRAIAARFAIQGEIGSIAPHSGGHINDSYRVAFLNADIAKRCFLQRINRAAFPDAGAVMENLLRITQHIAAKLQRANVTDWRRRVLTPIPTRDGGFAITDAAGDTWRMFEFIENTHVHLSARTPEQSEQAGLAFGEFQYVLSDLPPPPLRETIPGFHDTPARYAALDAAIDYARGHAQLSQRLNEARPELAFAAAHRKLGGRLIELLHSGVVPQRVAHNDAKLSNVLLDEQTGDALCVTDLDLVMPGTVLFDFGDMLRSMISPAAEDEAELARVAITTPLFTGLTRGYLAATRDFLTPAERDHLVTSGLVITLEQGVRFLTDFLRGDAYYKTSRPGQNLDRARVQFRLVHQISNHRDELERIARSL